MKDKKVLDMAGIEEDARAAEQAEAEARAEEDVGCYIHTFQKPFVWKDTAYTELRFQWDVLTGKDYLAVAGELERLNRMLIAPQFDGNFLAGIAARACTERDEKGKRVLSTEAIRSMPIRDFQTIIGSARSFFLRAALQQMVTGLGNSASS